MASHEHDARDPTALPDEQHGSSTLAQRLAFLELANADAERLQALATKMEPYTADFATGFYQHLFRFEESARFLRDPQVVERLKQIQQQHFASLLAAHWNEDYEQQRRRVGQVHADLGVDPELFLGAFNYYLQFMLRSFVAPPAALDNESGAQALSLVKAVFLDIGLTLDAYFFQSTQRLRHALDMLWRTNLELKQFAQFASHDLKTPLATVANLCDETLDEFKAEMPAAAGELIQAARNRALSMGKMIDELLSSAITSESADSNEEISAQVALDAAIDRLRTQLTKRGGQLKIEHTLPHVWGNSVRLREVFYNVLSNAIKYADKQPPTITIDRELDDDFCVISITDNGPGIPADQLESVFMPFRRLMSQQHVPGSGLGLYFAKNLMEHQAGTISVRSTLGIGSTFVLRLRREPLSS